MHIMHSRRDFLTTLSVTGAATALGDRTLLADEGPPEVTTIRLLRYPAICIASVYIAEDLLRAEGFTDIRYIHSTDSYDAVRGKVDLTYDTPTWIVSNVDAGAPVTALAGVHSGCYELFAHDPIRTLRDLKGKRVGISALGAGSPLYLATMAAHIGLDPHQDINWIVPPSGTAMQLFAEGNVDAYLAFPTEPQELRASKVGRVILNTATDQPWSQYFCCTVLSTRDFVQAYPIATKRARSAAIRILFVYSCRTGRPPSASCSASKASGLRSHCGRSLVRFNRQPRAMNGHQRGTRSRHLRIWWPRIYAEPATSPGSER